VAPADPYVMHIVQLDRLQAVFSVPGSYAGALHAGDAVAVHMASMDAPVQGAIEFVAPITDAESGTVRVKVCLQNPDGRYRSGQRCTLRLAENASAAESGPRPATALRKTRQSSPARSPQPSSTFPALLWNSN
jgi:hypothetical protein